MEQTWSADPDSNRIRAGLQSAASTASAFGAHLSIAINLAGEEGLEPSNARVRAECSGRCATPQKFLVAAGALESPCLAFQTSASPSQLRSRIASAGSLSGAPVSSFEGELGDDGGIRTREYPA